MLAPSEDNSLVWDSQIRIKDCYVKCKIDTDDEVEFFFDFEVYEKGKYGFLIQYTIKIRFGHQNVSMITCEFINYFSTKRAREIVEAKAKEIMQEINSVCKGTLLEGQEKEIKKFIDQYFNFSI